MLSNAFPQPALCTHKEILTNHNNHEDLRSVFLSVSEQILFFSFPA